jgi:hypothetical protein
MVITQHPSELHTIFNPCIIKVTKGAEAKAKIFIALGIYDQIPESYITVEREYFNNETYFDIKRILRNGISSGITEVGNCWIDKQFFVEYTVFDGNNATKIYSATATIGVAQLQKTSVMTSKRGYFLTNFERIKKYDSFPIDVVALAFSTGETYIRFDGSNEDNIDGNADDNFAQVNATVFVIPIRSVHYSIEIGNQNYDCFLRDNQGRVIEDNLGNDISWTDVESDYKQFILPIDNLPTPENPFYIRWINREGGWDYWMFGYRQFFNSSITNIKTFNPVVIDQQTASGFTEILSLDGIEKVKVGAQGLNQNDYDCISKLIYSPKIEWLNLETQDWQRITIDKGETEKDTRNILGELEFTFILPTPQLQF